MSNNMFCFQCEQTAGCSGCTGKVGVCEGKLLFPDVVVVHLLVAETMNMI